MARWIPTKRQKYGVGECAPSPPRNSPAAARPGRRLEVGPPGGAQPGLRSRCSAPGAGGDRASRGAVRVGVSRGIWGSRVVKVQLTFGVVVCRLRRFAGRSRQGAEQPGAPRVPLAPAPRARPSGAGERAHGMALAVPRFPPPSSEVLL